MSGIDWTNIIGGALIGAILGYPLGIFVIWSWERIVSNKRRRQNAIRIRIPRDHEMLSDLHVMDGLRRFLVHGDLGSLPDDHQIWLLTQSTRGDEAWPQGFRPVAYDKGLGTWSGYVTFGGSGEIRIIAVVAPPTSQRFFAYYENHGHETHWAPLAGVPIECKNRTSVLVQVP
jgi:hypothetical protein